MKFKNLNCDYQQLESITSAYHLLFKFNASDQIREFLQDGKSLHDGRRPKMPS